MIITATAPIAGTEASRRGSISALARRYERRRPLNILVVFMRHTASCRYVPQHDTGCERRAQ